MIALLAALVVTMPELYCTPYECITATDCDGSEIFFEGQCLEPFELEEFENASYGDDLACRDGYPAWCWVDGIRTL